MATGPRATVADRYAGRRGRDAKVELELTSDQEFFTETTGKFLEDKAPVVELRALRHDPVGFSRDYWRQGAELGWTSLLVSEDDGGGSISGRGVADLALVGFAFGRHAAPGPLVPNNVVAGALSRTGTDEQKAAYLPGILAGELLASWCLAEPRPHDRLGDVAVTATPSGDGFVLSGTKLPAESADQSDLLLVTARSPQGLTQLLVPGDAPGVTRTAMDGVDLTRRFASVAFDAVEVPGSSVLGEPAAADGDVEHQLQLALVIELAEMVGAMDKALEITIEWAFNRYSFGRPLASYQELKHRFADMKMWLEASHGLSDVAARSVQDRAPDAAETVSAAKAYIGAQGPELLHDCIQMHGGIGVTFDHDLHLYLRRVVLGSHLHGTVADHRERLTAILEKREGNR
jgi:alkylation response protein AidB-like acyl-CoA dehydrogenase